MDDFVLARVVHVLGVVLWIGGVAFVTTTLLPALRRLQRDGEDAAPMFERLEGRFAWQARVSTVLTGGSGLYMVHVLDAWERFSDPGYWWLHAMSAIWVIFTLMLFLLEPMVLHKWFAQAIRRQPSSTLALIHGLHWVLLLASMITVAGAVAGVHGG